MKKPIFIAEIKTQSPFGFKSELCFSELMELAVEHGDWVSVHTNALWGGDFDAISFVRRNTSKPILAKGIHSTNDDVRRALDHGADYVLVVDRFCNPMVKERFLRSQVLYECSYTQAKLMHFSFRSPEKYKFVCNSRNLSTGKFYPHSQLQEFIQAGLWTCQASKIHRPSDVRVGVNAFIVGQALPQFCAKLKYYE